MSTGLTSDEVKSLYQRYGHLVLRRCRRIMHDPALAEDATQEVFLKTLKYGASVRTAESELAWLYRVVGNTCFTLSQAQTRNRNESRALALAVDAQSACTANAHPYDDGWHGVLAELADTERTTAILLYADGLTRAEVSERLGRSRQTINKYVRNIRRLALKVLGEGSLSHGVASK